MSDLSRVEQLLRNALGEDIYEVTPQSRVEALLVELNDLIEEMGEASISPEDIATAVSAYLDEHLTTPTSPPVDTSLAIAGAAADAKKTGDEIGALKEGLNDIDEKIDVAGTNLYSVSKKTLTTGGFVPTGAVGSTVDPESVTSDSNMGYVVFGVSDGDAVLIKGLSKTGSNRRYYNVIDANNKVLASGVTGGANRDITVNIPANAVSIIINLRSDIDYTIYHQQCSANTRLKSLESVTNNISIGLNAYTSTPRYFRFAEGFIQGEFGGFAGVSYAMRLKSSIEFDHDTMLYVPDGFSIVIRYASTSARQAYDNYVYIPKNTRIVPAILYVDNTLIMTEDIARSNLYYTKPISFDDYADTFCSPGIFGEFAIIGDSYSLGSMHWENDGYKGYQQYSWGKLMCKRHGNNCTLYSHGGYGISRWITNILPTVLADDPKDLYWWGLGINDAADARIGTNVGSLDDLVSGDWTQYPDTLYGMYAKAYEQVKTHAPLAKHVFVSCIKETPNHRFTSYKAINTLLKDIANYYGVPFIDLVDDPFYVSKFYSDEVMTGHPTLIGYGGMSYANERLLNRCIANNVAYFRFYGRTNNPADSDPTGEL